MKAIAADKLLLLWDSANSRLYGRTEGAAKYKRVCW